MTEPLQTLQDTDTHTRIRVRGQQNSNLSGESGIKRLIANHDKPQLEAARNVLESVAALLEEDDFWTHQIGNNR